MDLGVQIWGKRQTVTICPLQIRRVCDFGQQSVRQVCSCPARGLSCGQGGQDPSRPGSSVLDLGLASSAPVPPAQRRSGAAWWAHSSCSPFPSPAGKVTNRQCHPGAPSPQAASLSKSAGSEVLGVRPLAARAPAALSPRAELQQPCRCLKQQVLFGPLHRAYIC